MPKYTYNGSGTKKFGEHIVRASGENFQTTRYFTDSDLSLLDHAPAVPHQPANTIFEGGVSSPGSGETNVDQNYNFIEVYNNTGAVVNISFNGLSGETATRVEVENGTYWTIDNMKKNVGTISADGSGSGTLKLIQHD